MSAKERNLIAIVLVTILIFVSVDLWTDSSEGLKWWHVATEGMIALGATAGLVAIFRHSLSLTKSLEHEKKYNQELLAEADRWRNQARRQIEDLSLAIDRQLTEWKLTESEKEIAFLLLKGMSLKEVAEIRQTTEKTARTQSMAIYAKSGCKGRSELSAFFLEDLLVPQSAQSKR